MNRHVVRLQEWFESKERYYLVFELAQGGELYEHLMDEGHFGENEAREVVQALAVSGPLSPPTIALLPREDPPLI